MTVSVFCLIGDHEDCDELVDEECPCSCHREDNEGPGGLE